MLQFQFAFAHEVLADFINKFDNYANFKTSMAHEP